MHSSQHNPSAQPHDDSWNGLLWQYSDALGSIWWMHYELVSLYPASSWSPIDGLAVAIIQFQCACMFTLCFDCFVQKLRVREYALANVYLSVGSNSIYRRSKDEIINYICYLNEIQKVSAQINRTQFNAKTKTMQNLYTALLPAPHTLRNLLQSFTHPDPAPLHAHRHTVWLGKA